MNLVSPFGELPWGWSIAKLADLTTKIGSGATPRGGSSTYLEQRSNYALVRSQCVYDRSLDTAALSFITDQQAIGLRGVQLEADDVLLNITGDGTTFGRCCQVPAAILPAVVNQHVSIIRPKSDLLDPGYLMTYLVHPDIKDYVEGFNAGGSRRAITKRHIESFEIVLPPIAEQREIAAILGAFDNKIELNRKTAATLEEMARALYRSWFVDFDPVWAKAESRTPAHMDEATAILFPDSFSDDGLPVGWGVKPLSSFCIQVKDSIDPRKNTERTFDHYSLPAFDAGNGPVRELGSTIQSQKLVIPTEAILFSRLNPRIPRIWWAHTSDHVYASVASTEFLVAVAQGTEDMPFLYSLLVSEEFRSDVIARVTGTSNSHQRVKPASVLEIEVTEATAEVRAAYGNVTKPWFNRINRLARENQTLATLRDTLLPKLMSGELRVGEAQELIEAVA